MNPDHLHSVNISFDWRALDLHCFCSWTVIPGVIVANGVAVKKRVTSTGESRRQLAGRSCTTGKTSLICECGWRLCRQMSLNCTSVNRKQENRVQSSESVFVRSSSPAVVRIRFRSKMTKSQTCLVSEIDSAIIRETKEKKTHFSSERQTPFTQSIFDLWQRVSRIQLDSLFNL